MNPAEIDALVASVQAAKAGAAALTDDADGPDDAADDGADYGYGAAYGAPAVGAPGRAGGRAGAAAAGSELPLGMLLDLSLPVSIELGRTSMTVQEILRLGRGAVIQLDRLAGEPIDIYVGDRRFAEGEVVVLGEHFGVRIVRIFAAPAAGGAGAAAAAA